jgi:hypothetical protein
VLSAESKTTQAADNKEMLDECHDIVWCSHTHARVNKNYLLNKTGFLFLTALSGGLKTSRTFALHKLVS